MNLFMKNLVSKLPLNRLVTYLVLLGFFPACFALFHTLEKKKEWEAVSERLLVVQNLSESKARKQYLNNIVRQNFADADPLYLENQLEALPFLKKERETLEKLIQSPTFTGNESAEKRYSFLASKANHLEFIQGSLHSAEGVEEAVCHLSHPIEMDTQDLKEVLTRIEGSRKGRPQLIITDFKLLKKAHANGNEVFEVNMKLLKREFHS